jgi:hypothetical protein
MFKKLWDIEIQRFNIFLEYWYVSVIVIVIAGIIFWKITRD